GLAAVGAGLATARGEAAAYARQLQIRGGTLERDRPLLTASGIDAQHRTHQRLRVRGHTAKAHVLGRSDYDEFAGVPDRDARRDVTQKGQLVRDEQHALDDAGVE